MHPFSTPVFLMFSGGRESVQSEQMGQSCYLRTNNRKMNMFLEKHIYSANPYQNIIQWRFNLNFNYLLISKNDSSSTF